MAELREMQGHTFKVEIYIAGEIATARQVCRVFCMERSDCVTVEGPIHYVYTGGEELGVRVQWIAYPRYPRSEEEIVERARDLGKRLMTAMCEHSFSIVAPSGTTWFSRREDGK